MSAKLSNSPILINLENIESSTKETNLNPILFDLVLISEEVMAEYDMAILSLFHEPPINPLELSP